MGKVNNSEALEMLKNGETQSAVARHFGVSRQAITPLARQLESQDVEVVKGEVGRPKNGNGNGHDTFEEMVRRDIAAREALLELPKLQSRVTVLERENAGLRKIIDDWQRMKNAYQQGDINSYFTERIDFRTKNLRLSIDITKIPIFFTQDSCYSGKKVLLCTPNQKYRYETNQETTPFYTFWLMFIQRYGYTLKLPTILHDTRKELIPDMSGVEERLGDEADRVVQFAKHFGISAAKQLYGKGIGYERFREFIEERLGPDGINRPMFNLYGSTGGADPLQFFFHRLSEVVIDEIHKRDNRIKFLEEKLDAATSQVESLKKLHNHRDIAPEIVDFTTELDEHIKTINNQG